MYKICVLNLALIMKYAKEGFLEGDVTLTLIEGVSTVSTF